MPVNFEYITTRDHLERAYEEIVDYMEDPLWSLSKTKPIIASDTETFGELLPEKRVPLPICYEEGDPTGLLRTLQIGLNPVYSPTKPVNNKQFVFDALYLGYDLLGEKFKPILENCNVIGHNLKYDYQFLFTNLNIELKHKVDTMLIGKVLLAGDPVNHGLDDSYERFIDYAWFKNDTKCDEFPDGMTFQDYIYHKKINQSSDWSGDLTDKQIKYAAEDVYFIFYLLDQQLEWLREYRETYESEARPKERINSIIRLENDLIPIIAQMELRGIPFDEEGHKDTIRQLTNYQKEALDNLGFKVTKTEKRSNVWCWLKEKGTPDEGKIHRVTGKNRVVWEEEIEIPLNMNSTQQLTPKLNELFQRDLGPNFKLTHTVKGEVKNSSKEDVIKTAYYKNYKDLQEDTREKIQWALQYKKATFLLNNFGEKTLRLMTKRGYIHPNWFQIGDDDDAVTTGRMSSSKPNCQNYPAREMLFKFSKKYGPVHAKKLFRDKFRAKKGWKIVVADFSQIEPRVAAELCGAKELIRRFVKGDMDIHAFVAKVMMDLPEEPAKDSYTRNFIGKTAGLSMLYGKYWTTLKDWFFAETDGQVDWTDEEAKIAWENFFKNIPEFRSSLEKWKRTARSKAEQYGNTLAWAKAPNRRGKKLICPPPRTVKGRPRRFTLRAEHFHLPDEMLSAEYFPADGRMSPYRERLRAACVEGFNHRIQGTAADIMKMSALYVHYELIKNGFDWTEGIVALVHDEIVLHVKEEHAELAAQILKTCMEKAGNEVMEKVPIVAEVGYGDTWADAKP